MIERAVRLPAEAEIPDASVAEVRNAIDQRCRLWEAIGHPSDEHKEFAAQLPCRFGAMS